MEQDQNNLLDHLNIRPVDKMPESYFVDLAKRTAIEKGRIITLKTVLWSVAAAIALLLVSLPLMYPSQSLNEKYSFNDITASEALAYVDHHISDFEDDLILDFINDEQLSLQELAFDIENDVNEISSEPLDNLNEIDTESILEYLIYEGIENDEIDEYEL